MKLSGLQFQRDMEGEIISCRDRGYRSGAACEKVGKRKFRILNRQDRRICDSGASIAVRPATEGYE